MRDDANEGRCCRHLPPEVNIDVCTAWESVPIQAATANVLRRKRQGCPEQVDEGLDHLRVFRAVADEEHVRLSCHGTMIAAQLTYCSGAAPGRGFVGFCNFPDANLEPSARHDQPQLRRAA